STRMASCSSGNGRIEGREGPAAARSVEALTAPDGVTNLGRWATLTRPTPSPKERSLRTRAGGGEHPTRRTTGTMATSPAAFNWIGQPIKRVEDARLLTGRGTFIDDRDPLPNVHHAAIVRSPHAHARISGYDLSAARARDGVVGIITGADVARLTKPF